MSATKDSEVIQFVAGGQQYRPPAQLKTNSLAPVVTLTHIICSAAARLHLNQITLANRAKRRRLDRATKLQ